MTHYEQGKFWIITDFNVDDVFAYDTAPDAFWISKDIVWSKGQLEKCSSSGRLHWQYCVCYERKKRLAGVKTTLGSGIHAELTKSDAAHKYVWKDETSQGRRWEWGKLPMRRQMKTDWDAVKDRAKAGRLDSPTVPAQVFVCHYSSLKKIRMDFMQGMMQEREAAVFWGSTGTGKSKTAWEIAGLDAYPKTPTTKFWDGYQGESHVVIDEFTGQIEITHLLRWLDRYPVLVEQKGSGCVLRATKFLITTNVPPEEWYQTSPVEQRDALMRRLKIFHFPMQLEEAKAAMTPLNLEALGSPQPKNTETCDVLCCDGDCCCS